MQYLHQTVVAVQLLFLRSDVLVNPTSFLAAGLTAVAVYRAGPEPRLAGAVPPLRGAGPALDADPAAARLHQQLRHVHGALAGAGALLPAARLRQEQPRLADRRPPRRRRSRSPASRPPGSPCPGWGWSGWRRSAGRPSGGGCAARSRRWRPAPSIFVLVGMPFLLRNVISRGYLVAPPEWQSFQLGGSATGPEHRAPPAGVQHAGARPPTADAAVPAPGPGRERPGRLVRGAGAGARVSGCPTRRSPCTRSGPGLIRHVSHRYDSNHAGLGAAFVLVTLPSLLALPFARRRLGPRWWYAVGLVVVGPELLRGAQHRQHLLGQQHPLPDRDGRRAGGARPVPVRAAAEAGRRRRWR